MTDHQPPPAVEAIGRLEAARVTLLALRSDALGSKGANAIDYRAAEAEYDAAVAAVETALRHSVEREAGLAEENAELRKMLGWFCIDEARAALDRRAEP